MASISKVLVLLASCAAVICVGMCVNLKADVPTLPSAYYGGRDDIQYFPYGSQEERLSNQKRALEQYKLEMQSQHAVR